MVKNLYDYGLSPENLYAVILLATLADSMVLPTHHQWLDMCQASQRPLTSHLLYSQSKYEDC